MPKRLITLAMFLLSSIVYANTSSPSWYQVEVLVFENKDKNALNEHWPLNPERPKLNNIAYLKRYKENKLQNFQLIPKEKYHLGDAKGRLKRQGHRMVFHKAWRQQIDGDHNPSLHLIGGKRYMIHEQPQDFGFSASAEHNISGQATVRKTYEMDGTITLTRSRFIHVNADLLFHKPMKILNQASAEGGFGSNIAPQNAKLAFASKDWQQDNSARLLPLKFAQSRRMKSNEVHYLDHPFYGMIVQVSPVKIEES